jgi:hypothetical protein
MDLPRPLEERCVAELIDTVAALLLELDGDAGASQNGPGSLEWTLSLQNAVWMLARELRLERSLPERVPAVESNSAALRTDPFVSYARLLHAAAKRMVKDRHHRTRQVEALAAATG